ncbi:MAG: nickel-binding protein, partial [Thermoanaerobaculia bacterium]
EVHGARWMRSYLSLDRKRIICEFEAADAEKVRESYRSAGVNFERVWSADVFSRENPTASY